MAIDPKIKEAIEIAVHELNQPEGLARKLNSWFEAIATGENVNDKQSPKRHLDLLYGEVQIENRSSEEEAS